MFKKIMLGFALVLVFQGRLFAAQQPLALTDFIQQAIEQDTEFEEILIDQLNLQYQHRLRLPATDLVLSVKQQHEFYFSQDRESPDTTIGLSKLFPFTGTELNVDYSVGANQSSSTKSSQLGFSLAQPIAENAFGRSTNLLDKIIGLEVEVSRYQITEAYEDYLATIITAYYDWYAAYENLLIAQNTYQENIKLLDNINDRQQQQIALPIDVNKVKLQVLSRKENLIEREQQYKSTINTIKRVLRLEDFNFIPTASDPLTELTTVFDSLYDTFQKESRTTTVLRNLEQQTDLELDREANLLLPSIEVIAGYEIAGEGYDIDNDEDFFYAGIQIEWPFTDQVQQAELEIAKIAANKQKLTTTNTFHRLENQLANLFLQIEREKQLIEIAQERVSLAQEVLVDEAENYSFGKITLNDYIQAFNDVDSNRFNLINRDVQYKKLIIEWLRLTDQLVNEQHQIN